MPASALIQKIPGPEISFATACTHYSAAGANRQLYKRRSAANPAAVGSAEEACTALVLSEVEEQYYREFDVGGRPELIAAAPNDFFELLGLEEDASAAEIRAAYRNLQRICHPDIAGDAATELSAILNSAYVVLSDDQARAAYRDAVRSFRHNVGTFDGRPVSRWAGEPEEQRAIFVDESVCIGCRHCTLCAPSTFFMEEEYGRARVHSQWGDDNDAVEEAVDMCPVDCIFYVKRTQLALLEFVMRACKREDISNMCRRRGGNFGPPPAMEDPFSRAAAYLRTRREARIPLDAPTGKLMQDTVLAAAIARAWVSLPQEVRRQGWPNW